MPGQQLSAHKMVVSRLLPIVLAGLVVACQSTSTGVGQFTPPYLQLRLCGGGAQLRWSDSSEWTAMEGEISVDGSGQIVADAAEGARFCLGDGSTLELAPGVTVEVQNPRVFPRLRVTLLDGSLLFEAQQPSYEFVVPVGSVTILDVPARLRIDVSEGRTHVLVEEGAVACALEMRTLTLLACWEMYAVAREEGEEPVEPLVIDYCAANAIPGLPTLTPFPSPTRWEAEPTATPTLSPTPSSTPSPTLTPTRRRVTNTPTSMPVTAPPATAPPATRPPATKPPATAPPPPPTDEPPPPPTDEPPPPPTEPPPTRPTVAPS
ncbi:MAG: FecR domain-containing protein [Anaerolineae bacterium]